MPTQRSPISWNGTFTELGQQGAVVEQDAVALQQRTFDGGTAHSPQLARSSRIYVAISSAV